MRRLCCATCVALVLAAPLWAAAATGGRKGFDASAHACYGAAWMHLYEARAKEFSDRESAVKHWQSAARLLAYAFERDPEEPLIGRPLHAAYLRLRMPTDAVAVLTRCPLERDGNPDDVRLLDALPDVSLVIRVYEAGLRGKGLAPARRPGVLEEAGRYCLNKRRYVRAAAFYEEAARSDEGNAGLLLKAAKLLAAMRQHQRAIALCRGFAEKQRDFDDPQVAAVLAELAAYEGAAGRAAEGARFFETLQARAPGNAGLCRSRVALLHRAGKTRQAEEVAQAFLKRHDDDRLRLLLAGVLQSAGETDRAANLVAALLQKEEFLKSPPQFLGGTALRVAVDLCQKGKPALSAKILELLLALPEDVFSGVLRDVATIELALAHSAMKDYGRARGMLNRLIAGERQTVRAHIALASVCWDADDREQALSVLRGFLKKQSTGNEALRVRARLADYVDRCGGRSDAVALLKTNLSEKPTDAETCNNLGYLYAESGIHLQEAVRLIETALKAEPDSAAYLDSLGWAQYKLALRDRDHKSLDAALKALAAAAKRVPDDPVVRDHLADVHYVLGKWPEALMGWRHSLKVSGGNVERLPNVKTVLLKIKTVQKCLAAGKSPEESSRTLRPPPGTVGP